MQLIGEVVFHKKFGKGEILDKLDRIIIIHFPAGKKKFYFPDAFEKIIHSYEKYRIKLKKSEELFFWDYFSLDDRNNKWRNVEIRYFSNNTMLKILRALQEKMTVPERRKLINEFYQYYLRVNKLE